MKILLCILVKNERECLEVILPRLLQSAAQANLSHIIAIDGNSTDGSISFLEENGIEILHQSMSGRGGAMIEVMKVMPADAYLFFSPDGNEDPLDLSKFCIALEKGYQLVIASRMMKGGFNEEDRQFFKCRKLANLFFNWMANMAFNTSNVYITDSINGYRAISKNLADRLLLDAHDYTIEYQMTIRALRKRAKIYEFPTYEYSRIAGDTGAKSIPTGLRFLKRFFIEYFRT